MVLMTKLLVFLSIKSGYFSLYLNTVGYLWLACEFDIIIIIIIISLSPSHTHAHARARTHTHHTHTHTHTHTTHTHTTHHTHTHTTHTHTPHTTHHTQHTTHTLTHHESVQGFVPLIMHSQNSETCVFSCITNCVHVLMRNKSDNCLYRYVNSLYYKHCSHLHVLATYCGHL
jgi:hypothetical protein